MRPLEGVRVLDFSTLLPGPLAGLLLAEAGAEVIKIERPGGEEMRHYPLRWGSEAVNFALLNRGKKSLSVDLKTAAGRDRIIELARTSDVLIDQFRPGVMDRLGLGYEALRKVNPKIIVCSITGYGQAGPRHLRAGHDLNYIGDTGLLALSHGDPGHRVVPPALIADIAGGAYPAVMNILLALRQRDATGEGCHLDVAMTDNMFTFMYWAMGLGIVGGKWPGSGDDLVTGGTPRYRLYDTQDGKVVAAAPIEQKFWESFTKAIGLEPDLVDDSKNPNATIARVAEILGSRPASHWAPVFEQADCCCTIVQNIEAAMANPHFRARGLFDHDLVNDKGETIPALPVPIDPVFRTSDAKPIPAPALGANNKEFGL